MVHSLHLELKSCQDKLTLEVLEYKYFVPKTPVSFHSLLLARLVQQYGPTIWKICSILDTNKVIARGWMGG
jgi:hypothetical protein